MTDKAWKKSERKVAKELGGKRIPASGSAQFEGELGDVFEHTFEVECKYRKHFAACEWFKVVRTRSYQTKKIPMLVVREKGMRDGELVVVSLKDFAQLYAQSLQVEGGAQQ